MEPTAESKSEQASEKIKIVDFDIFERNFNIHTMVPFPPSWRINKMIKMVREVHLAPDIVTKCVSVIVPRTKYYVTIL